VTYIKTAADFKELYPGFVAPDYDDDFLQVSKYASEKRTLVSKLAAIEKHIDAVLSAGPKTTKDKYIVEQKSKLKHADNISDDTMDELRKFEPSKLLKALADQGIVFSSDDFIKYLFGAKSLGHKADDMFSEIKKHLPSMFSNLEEDGDDVVNQEKYEPSHSDSLPKGLMNIVKGLFDDHSMFEQPAQGRIMKITIVKRLPTAKLNKQDDEKMSKESSFKELAKQYASYKLATLRYLESKNSLDEDTIFNVLVQNR
jgi:hypothetical protein